MSEEWHIKRAEKPEQNTMKGTDMPGATEPTTEPNTDPTEPTQEPTTEPTAEPTTEPGNGPKGNPDDSQRESRLQRELAAQKEINEQLKKQLDDAKTADEVQAAIDKAKADAEEATKKAEEAYRAETTRLRVENALTAAGSIDNTAAMAHIDMEKVSVAEDGHLEGLDTEQLAKDLPYLFKQPTTVSTGAPANGGSAPVEINSIKAALAAIEKK